MKLTSVFKALAVSAGIAASFSSFADPIDFDVDEGAFSSGEILTGNKFTGPYGEQFNRDGDTFTTFAVANFPTIAYDNNVVNGAIGNEYKLYAVFEATGGSITQGVNGTFQTASFTAEQGMFTLFLDSGNDTMYDFDTNTWTGQDSDVELGSSSSLTENLGSIFYNADYFNSSFNLTFEDFTLTDAGDTYFVGPSPFSTQVTVSGDYDRNPLTNDFLIGDVSAEFGPVASVPEPSTIAVLSLGLIGLGMSSRRKKK